MKDRAILCNIGHFDNEIQVDALKNYKWTEIELSPWSIGKDNYSSGGQTSQFGITTGHPAS